MYKMTEPAELTVLQLIPRLRDAAPLGSQIVVAGGFIRDSLLGRPPKDIDVFISDAVVNPAETRYGCTTVVHEVIATGPLGPHAHRIDGYMSESDPDITEVWNIGEFHGYQVQVIGIAPRPFANFIDVVFSHIDFGICRVAHDGNKLHVSYDFEHDARYDQFTLRGTHTPTRSLERFERLTAEKYKGWTFFDPSEALSSVAGN